MTDQIVDEDGAILNVVALAFRADFEIEHHPTCPACGQQGCETNHKAEEQPA